MTVLHCHHFADQRCRSCSLLELPPEQARLRQLQILHETTATLCTPEPPFWCSTPTGSRIRGRLAVAGSSESPVFGFFNDEHQLVPAADCPLHHPLITGSLNWLTLFIKAAKLEPYSPENDRGELKFMVLTASPSTGKLMVQWVLRSRESIDRIQGLWRRLSADERGSVTVMSAGIQPKRSSRISCETNYPISAEQSLEITYPEPGISLFVAPGSFVQSNYEVAGALYAAAAARLHQARPRRILDLYCGSGGFSLLAARTGAEVLGVDVSSASIDCAGRAAARLGLSAEFRACPAGALQPTELGERFDAVICNPPRAGLDPATTDLLHQLSPRVILYSSCNPTTLARDLQRLSSHYAPTWIRPFEMFPGTTHWEVLCQADFRG